MFFVFYYHIDTTATQLIEKSVYTVQIYIVLEIDCNDNDEGTTTTSICHDINFINS